MKKITFVGRQGFYPTLKQRVNAYFSHTGKPQTGTWRMFLKTATILSWLAVSYILLVFFSTSWLMAVLSAFAVAQGCVLVGFNIMHDGNHGSYSRKAWLNRVMGMTMDLIGGSSLLWKQKHNILHHTYTNIDELDDDIQSHGLLRLSPRQPWRPWHRMQHIFAFPLYSLLTITWVTFSDFKKFFSRRIGSYPLGKSRSSENWFFLLSKLFYFGYALILPMFFHPVAVVLLFFLGIHLVLGLTLSVVFQLAHTIEGNDFPAPDPESASINNEWAIHQVETTANFAPTSKLACWYLGGLNFQIEHHLFSKICHIHYPQIGKIVRETCQEFGISYVSYPSVWAALRAHFRFLRELGHRPSVEHA